MSTQFAVALGKEVRGRVTGLRGIVTARSENLYGCNRYYVQPRADMDGKVPDGWWTDEMDLEVVGDGVTQPAPSNSGGPMSRTV